MLGLWTQLCNSHGFLDTTRNIICTRSEAIRYRWNRKEKKRRWSSRELAAREEKEEEGVVRGNVLFSYDKADSVSSWLSRAWQRPLLFYFVILQSCVAHVCVPQKRSTIVFSCHLQRQNVDPKGKLTPLPWGNIVPLHAITSDLFHLRESKERRIPETLRWYVRNAGLSSPALYVRSKRTLSPVFCLSLLCKSECSRIGDLFDNCVDYLCLLVKLH